MNIKNIFFNKKPNTIIIIAVILLVLVLAGGFIFWQQQKNKANELSEQAAQSAKQAEATEYYADSGQIKAEVMNLEKKEESEYARLKISEIVSYNRHPNAKHDQLKVGDEVVFYLGWGSAPKDVELDFGSKKEVISIPGLKAGDNIEANFAGCPGGCNSGYGWSVYAYNQI